MNYNDIITSAKVVLVEFYASWCPHCHKMVPVMDQIKELLDGRVPVYQLDIDSNQEAADNEKVKSVPTFLIYKDGREAWRQSGEIDGEILLSKVESYL